MTALQEKNLWHKNSFLELSGTSNALLKKKTVPHNVYNADKVYTKCKIKGQQKSIKKNHQDFQLPYLLQTYSTIHEQYHHT